MDHESWYDYFSSRVLFGNYALKPTEANIKAALSKIKIAFSPKVHPNKKGCPNFLKQTPGKNRAEKARIFFAHLTAAKDDDYTPHAHTSAQAPQGYEPPPFKLLQSSILSQYTHKGWVYAHPAQAQVRWLPPQFSDEAIKAISKRVYERLVVPLDQLGARRYSVDDAERHLLRAYPALQQAIDSWRAGQSVAARKKMYAGDFIVRCMLADLYSRSLYRGEGGIRASTLQRHPGDVSQFYFNGHRFEAELWDLMDI